MGGVDVWGNPKHVNTYMHMHAHTHMLNMINMVEAFCDSWTCIFYEHI